MTIHQFPTAQVREIHLTNAHMYAQRAEQWERIAEACSRATDPRVAFRGRKAARVAAACREEAREQLARATDLTDYEHASDKAEARLMSRIRTHLNNARPGLPTSGLDDGSHYANPRLDGILRTWDGQGLELSA